MGKMGQKAAWLGVIEGALVNIRREEEGCRGCFKKESGMPILR